MNLKVYLFLLVFFATFYQISAQSADSKWVFGVHLATALYQDDAGDKIGGSIISQVPRLSIAMYFKKGFTLEGALGISTIDTQKYTTFDGAIRYDFKNSAEKVVPYIMLGRSFISARRLTPTLNFGVGNTFWIFPNYGLNIQMMYKFSETRFGSQFSHFYPSAGLIYSPKPRNLNPRLWDRKH
jgi:hypothetical protein